jgi:hypothetical protein
MIPLDHSHPGPISQRTHALADDPLADQLHPSLLGKVTGCAQFR